MGSWIRLCTAPAEALVNPVCHTILEQALAYFDCELTASMRAGDHELVLGRVVEGRILDPGGAPLVYAETGDLDGSSTLYPAAF